MYVLITTVDDKKELNNMDPIQATSLTEIITDNVLHFSTFSVNQLPFFMILMNWDSSVRHNCQHESDIFIRSLHQAHKN
jgi:hypothetical protein